MIETPVQRFYRFQAPIYNLTRWAILHGRKSAIDRLELQKGQRVLEVGCGTGSNFKHLITRLHPPRGRLVAVDFSEAMLRRARSRVQRRGWLDVHLVAADAAALPFGDRFDRIFFSYSLTMMPNWADILEEAVDHLEPGGRLGVVDFGRFERWGPAGAVMRGYLKLNHVDTHRPILDRMGSLFPRLDTYHWLGGYNFVAVGVK